MLADKVVSYLPGGYLIELTQEQIAEINRLFDMSAALFPFANGSVRLVSWKKTVS
jgi:hypothetical protein